jgi:hypothetical protein
MRAALAVMMLAAVSIPRLTRAQSDADEPVEIPVHARVTTVLQMPETVVRARFTGPVTGMMKATNLDNTVLIRPRARVSVGTTVALTVITATMYRRFRLRVVQNPDDAWRRVVLLRSDDERAPEETTSRDDAAVPEDTARDAEHIAPAETEPAASANTPAVSMPRAGHVPEPAAPKPAAPGAREHTAPMTGAAGARAPRFDLAVHGTLALPGFTALEIAGYRPQRAWRLHQALGVRLSFSPHDAWWAVEADVSGTRLAGRMKYDANFDGERYEVSGSWLRAEVGMRARTGTRWIPSLYTGIGLQAHLRRLQKDGTRSFGHTDTVEDGVVLVLGVGLHRRFHDVLCGVEFQARRGGPDDYSSMTALWTVGYFLDQGE